ncbi:MAG: carotenoid oxygenase family protein [Lautropia sp.]
MPFSRPLPAALAGTLYRNGPARMRRGPTAYQHWFDGDGMVHSFRLDGDSLRHHARMVRTDKYVKEEQAGRLLYSGFGSVVPGTRAPERPDAVNVANISVLPVANELLALWEGGSPYRIDPATLATLGRKVWSPETDGVAFSAHPKVDRDGTIWSFGYLPGSGRLVLYRLDAAGRMRATRLIESANADMVHDFAITGRWLVFVLMPLLFDRERQRDDDAFLSRFSWHGERAGNVLLVDKETLTVAHRFEIPATPFFHVGNAWDDGDTVRVQLMRLTSFDDAMQRIRDALAGRPASQRIHTGPVEISVTPGRGDGSVRQFSATMAEFPAIDPRFVGRRNRALFTVTRTPAMPDDVFGWNAVARIDGESGRTRQYDYGAQTIVEEHLFVPRPDAAEGDGWLVGTAYDFTRRRTLLSVFDATAVDAGPIAQARLPYGLPFGLHGAFVRG